MPVLGRLVADKYRLLHVLGRGGMGTVWAAEHIDLRSKVAIKFVDPKALDDWRAIERFAREARAAAALRGPHVVQILDHGTYDGAPYIVMEYLEGETLSARLRREARLTPREVLRVERQISMAMTRAHTRGIVHRDLKPANVFLADDDVHDYTLKVLDFGLAKALREEADRAQRQITDSGTIIGTLEYMSPEQIRGVSVEHYADLWSIAVIAFQCLTGVLPFHHREPQKMMRAICSDPIIVPSTIAVVPAAFDSWFAKATHRNPTERFETAGEMADHLALALEAIEDRACACELTELGQELRRKLPMEMRAFSTHREPKLRETDRIPSSIPAALNGRRDLEHVALIVSISRTGALLWTRLAMETGQELRLSIHFVNETHGHQAMARVVRTMKRPAEHAKLWLYDVAVSFLEPLEGVSDRFEELLQQASLPPTQSAPGLEPPTPTPA